MVIIALLDCDEGLFQVGNQVIHVFKTNRKPNSFGMDIGQFLSAFRELDVGGCRRVDNERTGVTDVCLETEYFYGFQELDNGCAVVLFKAKTQDCAGTLGEILGGERLVLAVFCVRVIDPRNFGARFQKFYNLFSRLYRFRKTFRKGFNSKKHQVRIERGDGTAQVIQVNGADTAGERRIREHVVKTAGYALLRHQEMRLAVELWELSVFPVELAVFYNGTGNHVAVTRKALGGRINNHVGAKIKRIQQVGGCHRVVDNQRDSVLVGDICDRFDIQNGGVRVGDRFDVDYLGVFFNECLEICRIVRVFYNVILDARLSESYLTPVSPKICSKLSKDPP